MSAQMGLQQRSKLDFWIITLTSLGSLVCLNVLASTFFFRADLTREKAYTLSESTAKVLADLEDPVHVTGYFTENLPPPYATAARDVSDLLEEYRALSKGKVSFEIIAPETLLSEDEKAKKKDVKRDIFGQVVRTKTGVDEELAALGVQPVEVRVIENDQRIQKPGYMGVVIRYQDLTKAIPVVRSASGLEYDLTTQIRNLTRTRQPVLGVLQGGGEASLSEDLARLSTALTESYEVRPVALKDDTGKDKSAEDANKALEDVDTLLIAGTSAPYGPDALAAIDGFLMKGRGAVFLLDPVKVDLKTFAPTPNSHGFGELVSAYGVALGDDIVADAECDAFSISERRSFMVVQRQVKYPFFPVAKTLEQEHPVTKGLTGLTLPWATPLLPAAPDGCTLTTLVKSSEKSWIESATPQNLSPQRDWGKEQVNLSGPYPLAAAVSGPLPSAFSEGTKSAKESRVVVVGTSGLVLPNFLNAQSGAFLLNSIDWAMLDNGLLEMRTRGQQDPPIDDELSDAQRLATKWFNVGAIPFLLTLVGFLNWRRRVYRRRRIAKEIAA